MDIGSISGIRHKAKGARQEILPVPYALSLVPPASVCGC
jgi:hypothetical protein